MRYSRNNTDWLNRQFFLRFDKILVNSLRVFALPKKCDWSGALSYEYPGDSIMPSTPKPIISSKNERTELGSAPSKSVVFVVTRKPRFTASRMPAVAVSY